MPVTKEPTTRSDEDTPAPRKVKAQTKYKVRRVTEEGNDPVIFSHEDKETARRHVVTNHPRGLEVYLQHPDGYREHFSADLSHQGHESGGWQELTDEDFE